MLRTNYIDLTNKMEKTKTIVKLFIFQNENERIYRFLSFFVYTILAPTFSLWGWREALSIANINFYIGNSLT